MARYPGLPLSTIATQHRAQGVRFSCLGCGTARDVPFATVVADLERRKVGGWATRIGDVAGRARKPCACGAMRWETRPWWA